MKMKTKTLTGLLVAGLFGFTSANATILDFDGTDSQKGVYTDAGTYNTGPHDVTGDWIRFNIGGGENLMVKGSLSTFNLTSTDTFEYSELTHSHVRAYQDRSPNLGGLGVYQGSSHSIGSDDSFQSNVENNGDVNFDEVLLFRFSVAAILNEVLFNGSGGPNSGGHNELVASGPNRGDNAIFNIFYSDNSQEFHSIYDNLGGYPQNARAPDNSSGNSSLAVDAGQHKWWAVAATGWGEHTSYVEAIVFEVPEPSIIALFGLGLLGLGFASRRRA
jgi:hypothetical protein